jgi:predicted site-specific integrase-resolvase
MIRIPGNEPLYEPVDASFYCGVSARTLNRWRREGWLKPSAAFGRGFLYLKADLDGALHALGYDRKNLNVEIIYDNAE